jgi:PAS domain S-box-containing protein
MSSAPTDGQDGPAGYPHSELVLDCLPLGIVFQNAQGEIRAANPAAERILGLSLDQMRGVCSVDPRWRAIHEDGSPLPGEQHPAMVTLRTGEPVQDVIMGVFNPQREAYTWINVSSVPIRDPASGVLEGVYVSFEDITARKTAQLQEAASEARFHAAFAAMSEGLVLHRMVYDAAGHPVDYRILDVNSAFTAQTGLAREAVVGQLGSVAYGTGSAPFLDCYVPVARTGQAQVFETYFEPLARHFRISIFSPEPDHFGTVFEDITERKRAEVTLQRQRTMLARTERITHVGSWEWEVATDSVTWSEELFRIFQRDPAKGAPSYAEHQQLYTPEDMQRLHAAVDEALHHGTAYELELRAICRDGAIRVCLAHGEAERDQSGRITHLTGSLQDITERKSAEEALRESERRYRELVEHANSAILRLSGEGTITFINPYAQALFGWSAAEAIGCPISMLLPEQDAAGTDLTTLFHAFLAQPEQFTHHINVCRNGRRLWMSWTNYVGRDDQGEVREVVAIGNDVTEQKRAEAELDHYRQELESLVEQRTAALRQSNDQLGHTQFAMDRAGIGIAWNNADTGQFIYANDEICRQLGYTREEIMALTVSDINPEFSPEALRQLADDLRTGSSLVRIESWHRRKDQSTYPVALTVYLHHVGDEKWFIAFTEDISARKAVEAELIQARDAAEAANRAKSAFLANMSHEIRTPLNAVLGMVHLMRQDALPSAQAKRLDKIEVAGHHLLDLINVILDLSKIEDGKLTLEESAVRVEAIMRNLVAMLSDRVAEKGLKLCVQLKAWPSDLLGDSVRLQQALLNYASNAIKFTKRGSITVRAFPEADLGDSVVGRFEVEDTGIGIAAEHLPRLFTEFEQVDASITRQYGGTGLGLALTKQLAQLMGGEVGVESTQGVGSTFWFTVRLRRGTSPSAVTETAPVDQIQLLQVCAGRRLLLVEDEPINREVTLELLADLGLRIDTAEHGAEALECVRQHRYDFILMDMQMPIMDGLEATRRIRQLPLATRIPIVAMTANAFAEDQAQCLEAGMDDFLTKPVEPARLMAVIQHWLSRLRPT